MAEQSWWTRDAEGIEHPDDAALLAFVREELAKEKAQEVYRHFSECARCQEYCRVGRLLYRMQSAYEADASVAKRVFAYINNPANAWQAKQRKRLRQLPGDIELGLALVRFWTARQASAFLLALKSKTARATAPRRTMKRPLLVWTFVLLLTATMVAFVLAHQHLGVLPVPKANSGIHKAVQQPTFTVPPQPTDTPTPVPTHTAAPNSSAAAIQVCATSINRFQERVGICGYHFRAGDKLELWVYVAGGQPRLYRALIVNVQGQFQMFLVITQCKETIEAMYVADLTNKSVHPAVLKNIQVGRCVAFPEG